MVRGVDCHEASPIRQAYTIDLSTRDCTDADSAYSWNSTRVVAAAACTSGQLPAVQESTLLEAATLLSGQYAAAAYCS